MEKLKKNIQKLLILTLLLFILPLHAQNNTATVNGIWNNCATCSNPPAIYNNFSSNKVINEGINVTLNGTPTTNGTINIPITVAGISCNLTVNVLAPVPLTITSVGFNFPPNYPTQYPSNIIYRHNSSSPEIWNGSYTTPQTASVQFTYYFPNGIRVVASSRAPIYFPGVTTFNAAN